MTQEKREESTGNLLEELCGADVELYTFLSRNLYESPLSAISKKDLKALIAEAEQSGSFGQAMDKVVFANSQNPEERERYAGILRDLAGKAIASAERKKDEVAKQGSPDRVVALNKRIEEWQFMIQRAEDILDVGSTFYNEKLLEREQDEDRKERKRRRLRAENEEQAIKKREEHNRSARKRARRKMGWAERKEARKREKLEREAADERRAKRAQERTEAARDEVKIEEAERAGRQERKVDRNKGTDERTDATS